MNVGIMTVGILIVTRFFMSEEDLREGVKKNNYFFSSLLLLRGPATPPSPLSSPVDNLDFRSIF